MAAGSLAFKLGAAFVLVVLMAVGGMGAYAYSLARRSAVQQELDSLRTLSFELSSRINLSLAAGRGLADHLASTRNVQDYLGQRERSGQAHYAIQEWLDQQAGKTQGLSAVFVMSPEGKCLASSNRLFEGRDFSFRSYFQTAMGGHLAASDWIIGSVTRTPRIFSAAPVRLQGRIAGVLVTEFLVDEIEEAIRRIGVNGRTATLFNAQGIVLSHSNAALQYHALMPLAPSVQAELKRTKQFLDREIFVDPVSEEFVAAFKRTRDTSQPQTLNYKMGTTYKWGALSYLVDRQWVVAVGIPEAEILLPIHKALRSALLVGAATTLGVFLLALALGRSLLHPIHRLSEAMGRFGAGDIAARSPVLAQDERGQLAREFNAMADALQIHQDQL
ncbi:MAG: cache domain-containing protein, partial [Holophaga sp.]|nr:cache domain-containing protein [Holophaga sp.]